jgi:hypothetical protein
MGLNIHDSIVSIPGNALYMSGVSCKHQQGGTVEQ